MVNFPLFNHPGLLKLLLGLRLIEPLWVVTGGVLAYWLRHGLVWVPSDYMALIILSGAGFAVMASLLGCYQHHILRQSVWALPRLSLAMLATLAILMALLFSLKASDEFSRIWLGYWLINGVIGLHALRLWAQQVLRTSRKKGAWQRRIAVYGISGKTMPILDELQTARQEGLVLAGIYDDNPGKVSTDLQQSGLYVGNLKQLLQDGQARRFTDVIVALDITQYPHADGLLSQLHALPLNVFYCLPLPFFGRVQQDILLPGIPLVQLYHQPLAGHALWLKRLMDISISGAALVALAPVMAALAVGVKLSSSGPVFFRQQRGGFNGGTFEMLKFRSMKSGAAALTDASGKEQQATKTDPRITPFGRFIRKSSLDELPQLINVLRGDMSLIGPRPHAMSHDSHYAILVDRYASRQKIRPGLTGWAQLNGWRGETETLEKMAKRVEYDIWYIENYSLGLDLKILFMTPFALIFQRNAY